MLLGTPYLFLSYVNPIHHPAFGFAGIIALTAVLYGLWKASFNEQVTIFLWAVIAIFGAGFISYLTGAILAPELSWTAFQATTYGLVFESVKAVAMVVAGLALIAAVGTWFSTRIGGSGRVESIEQGILTAEEYEEFQPHPYSDRRPKSLQVQLHRVPT